MKTPYFSLLIALVMLFQTTACKAQKQDNESETHKGTYRSVMGVMNNLSCYCYNCGFLTTEEGKKINVSFDKLTDEKVKCSETMTVTGHFITKINKENPNSPCPAGERKIFIVSSYNCE